MLARELRAHPDSWEISLLEIHTSLKDALAAEKFWILKLKTKYDISSSCGYNMTDGGEGYLTSDHTARRTNNIQEMYVGQRVGKLVVKSISEPRGSRSHRWAECQCDCGNTKQYQLRYLFGKGRKKFHAVVLV